MTRSIRADEWPKLVAAKLWVTSHGSLSSGEPAAVLAVWCTRLYCGAAGSAGHVLLMARRAHMTLMPTTIVSAQQQASDKHAASPVR